MNSSLYLSTAPSNLMIPQAFQPFRSSLGSSSFNLSKIPLKSPIPLKSLPIANMNTAPLPSRTYKNPPPYQPCWKYKKQQIEGNKWEKLLNNVWIWRKGVLLINSGWIKLSYKLIGSTIILVILHTSNMSAGTTHVPLKTICNPRKPKHSKVGINSPVTVYLRWEMLRGSLRLISDV